MSGMPGTKDGEFARGLRLSGAEVARLVGQSFAPVIRRVLEDMRGRAGEAPGPTISGSPPVLTQSGRTTQATNLEVMVQLTRHLAAHTAQIPYIAKMPRGRLPAQ